MTFTVPGTDAVTAMVEPMVSRGFRRARHAVRVHNGGDVPVSVDIAAEDPDRLLELEVVPSTLGLDPGATGRARIRARVIPGWPVGEDRSRSFRATVAVPGQAPAMVDLQMQLRVLPPRTPVALAAVAAVVVVALLVAGRGTDRGAQRVAASASTTSSTVPGRVAPAGTGTTAPAGTGTTAPAQVPAPGATTAVISGASTSTSSSPSPAAPGAPASGPMAAITAGAGCRTTADLRVEGRTLTNGDGSFVRRFGDDSTALTARNLLARRATFCTVGSAARDDAELTFFPPPVEATPAVPGSRCTSRYLPERLVKNRGDNTFVIEVGPGQYLFYAREEDRDRAFTLLQGHSQICWLGGGPDDIFSTFFDWGAALTYF